MQAARHLFAQRYLAVLLCAATLVLRLLVPTGYMIDDAGGRLAIVLCSGAAPASTTMVMAGAPGDMPDHGKGRDHGKAQMPCAFSSLSAAALGTIDPIQLAALIAFVLALGLVVVILPAPSRSVRLRPPLRGPPGYR